MKRTGVPSSPAPPPPPDGPTARRLLEATLAVIAGQGVDAVTHRKVAGEARVSLGACTHHFPTREDLLRGAFRFHAARSFELIRALEAAVQPRRLEDAVAFLVELVRRELEEPWRIVVEYELLIRATRDPVLAAEARGYEEGLRARLGGHLERFGVARPLAAARTLVGVVRGFEVERLLDPRADLADLERRLRTVQAAIAPSPRRPPRSPR
jgi:TetR/AcrR family transcriptional regulator, regulator of biofilm formation and stress response